MKLKCTWKNEQVEYFGFILELAGQAVSRALGRLRSSVSQPGTRGWIHAMAPGQAALASENPNTVLRQKMEASKRE
jgi:hypothetical protein